jgi:hypothetical protein
MVVVMVKAFPVEIIGLVAIFALGLLFTKALKEQPAAMGNDHYSKDVEK